MKWRIFAAVLWLAGALIAPPAAKADLIERSFREADGESVITAWVLQGSRDMRRLGERRSPSSHRDRRPFLDAAPTVPVLPALETEELRPRPRFGYGSDWHPSGENGGATSAGEEEAPETADRRPDRTIRPKSGALRRPWPPVLRFRSFYPFARFHFPFRHFGHFRHFRFHRHGHHRFLSTWSWPALRHGCH